MMKVRKNADGFVFLLNCSSGVLLAFTMLNSFKAKSFANIYKCLPIHLPVWSPFATAERHCMSAICIVRLFGSVWVQLLGILLEGQSTARRERERVRNSKHPPRWNFPSLPSKPVGPPRWKVRSVCRGSFLFPTDPLDIGRANHANIAYMNFHYTSRQPAGRHVFFIHI